MEERRKYIEKVIAENSKNSMEEAAIRNYAIKQEVGTPTPQNDLPNLKRDRIVLELENRTSTDETINLFELPKGINSPQQLEYGDLFETKYSEVIIPVAELSVLQKYTIDWLDENGASQSATVAGILGIANLISALDTATTDSWGYFQDGTDYVLHKQAIDTWLYWIPPPPFTTIPAGTKPASFYTENEYLTIIAVSSTIVYPFTSYNVIGGSGISITETSGNLTYAELVQELRNNIAPYIFKTMTIYADNIDQASVPMTKTMRGQAGNTRKLIDNPTIINQTQFVVTEEINFSTKSLNKLDYVVKANQTVKIIFTYTKGNLNAIADVINEYISDGIPFDVAITQLAEKVSEKEKEYLKATLKSIWKRKSKELALEGVQIDIDNIFEPQEVIDSKKATALGDKMKLVKRHIEEKRLKKIELGNISPSNIKRLVANYAAKGVADKMYDPYSYVNGDE
jgi:hypothetical protein